MKRNFLSITVILLIAFLLATCTKDKGLPLASPNTTGGPVVPTLPDSCKVNIKFATQIQPILNTYCAINSGCHAQNNPWGNFTTYGGFAAKSSIVVGRITDPNTSTKMPAPNTLGPKNLDECQISKIKTWVAEGAQNN